MSSLCNFSLYIHRKYGLNTLDCGYNGGDDFETDAATVEKKYFRKNCKSTGYVTFSVSALIIIRIA